MSFRVSGLLGLGFRVSGLGFRGFLVEELSAHPDFPLQAHSHAFWAISI